ncbi:MAG: C25 family cysteine peptidase [bacterium]|nr:C25 family cysteine peptidase [bacterium]
MRPCRGFLGHSTVALVLACLLALGSAITLLASPFNTYEPRLPQNCDWLTGPEAVRSMPSEVVDPNPRSVRLKFFEPPLEYGSVTVAGQLYETVRLTGEGSIAIPGDPELPKVSRLVMIASRGNVKLSIVRSSYHLEYLKGDIAPTQEMMEGETAPVSGAMAPSPAVYSANEWYPAATARISEPATLRDVRFVGVTVYPVQVNPVTREMRVYDEIEIEISDVGGTGPNEIPFTPESIDPGFKKLYGAFENFRGSTLDELPVVPGEYVVICRNYASTVAQAQRLVDWHKRKGLNATLALTSASYDSVRSIIRTRYIGGGGRLAYACVIGDPQNGGDSLNIATHSSQYDNFFGTGLVNPNGPDNPDPVPEVAVGRISVTNGFALQAVVDKTILYETAPYTGDVGWFTRTWCAAHIYAGASVYSLPSFKRYTEAIMRDHGIAPVLWTVFTGVVVADTIEAKVATGISVFNHRMAWISEMSTADLDGLSDSWMWPFVMSITCNTGSFNSGTSVSEAWLTPTGQLPEHYRGAIGCVGLATSGTHTRLNNALDAGTMYGLYVRDIDEQGVALIAGKLQMYVNYWDDNPTGVQNFSYWSNLMGDPAVPIWKQRPWLALVTKPATVNVGTNHVRLTVRSLSASNPVPGALVCLWKSGQSYSRGFTDAGGQIDLPCTTATTGDLLLTVTHDDLIALLDTIHVVNSNAWLALDSVLVDDDNIDSTTGDGNHIISPGETVHLTLRLRNAGTSQTVTGITATLVGPAPGIEILRQPQCGTLGGQLASLPPGRDFSLQSGTGDALFTVEFLGGRGDAAREPDTARA